MHYPIDHSETPIRLFQNDFLEFFTHISPITVVVIWLPFRRLHVGPRDCLPPGGFLLAVHPGSLPDRSVCLDIIRISAAPLCLPLQPAQSNSGENYLPLSWHPPPPAAMQNSPGYAACRQHPARLCILRPVQLDPERIIWRTALGSPHDLRLYHRLSDLRSDSLCHPPFPHALWLVEIHQTLPYGPSFPHAGCPLWGQFSALGLCIWNQTCFELLNQVCSGFIRFAFFPRVNASR